MALKRIGLVTAMPEETKPLVKRLGKAEKGTVGELPSWRFKRGEKEIVLVESGMGPRRATAAAEALIAEGVEMVASLGVAGAVRGDLAVGDVVLCREARLLTGDNQLHPLVLTAAEPPSLPQFEGIRVVEGCAVTAAAIRAKKETASLLPPEIDNPVLEMETAAVAKSAVEHGLPFMALRAISDPADEELAFSIDEFTDSEMNIRIGKVIRVLIRRPSLLPQLMRLAGNTATAAKNLAAVAEALIDRL